jgi:hypothetical protein
MSHPTVVALHQAPKSNGLILIVLAIVLLSVSAALYVGATRHKLGRSGQKNFDTIVKWAWGYGMGAIGVACAGVGVFVIITGK